MRHFIKAMAAALPLALGALMPLAPFGGMAQAQTEDLAQKERRLTELALELLPASRLPEIYADLRRAVREVHLPVLRQAARNEIPGATEADAALMAKLGTYADFLDYALRAADEADPFLAENGERIVRDLAGVWANHVAMPEIEAAHELANMPAMRKVFNTMHAASRLMTGFSYQEVQDYYKMTAWMRELRLDLGEGLASPESAPPPPDQVGKAQSVIEDLLRISRLDEMVTKVLAFVRNVQLQSTIIPEDQREAVRQGLERFEFVYNLQKSMLSAVGPSMLSAVLNAEQLEKLHLLVLSPLMAKSFGLIDDLVREATSFSTGDIESLQAFSDRIKAQGLFKERGPEEQAQLSAEISAVTGRWRERLLESLSPETRQGLERSYADLEAMLKDEAGFDDDDEDDGEGDFDIGPETGPAPGQRDL